MTTPRWRVPVTPIASLVFSVASDPVDWAYAVAGIRQAAVVQSSSSFFTEYP
jgi:hypothetical protein